MATLAVQTGYDILNGKPPAKPVILLPTPAVTKANIASYTGWTKH
jgi:ribose transport system substrate-binding protein